MKYPIKWGVVGTCELCAFFFARSCMCTTSFMDNGDPFYLLSALKLSAAVLAASELVKA